MLDHDIDKRKLTLLGLFALGISGIAPTSSMAYSTAATAKVAGYNVPLSYLLGGCAIICVAICFAGMAKYVSDAGSAYAYVRQTFGEKGGFVVGWLLAFAYFALLCSQPGLDGNFTDVLIKHFGWHLPITLLTFIIIFACWMISLFGIKVTSVIAFTTESISLLILLVLSGIILYKAGMSGALNAKPFIPHHNYAGIGQGMIFSVLSFSGFEEISTVSIRSNRPKKTIPKTLIWTVILMIIFFTLVTFVEVNGFGLANTAAFANSPSPLDTLSEKYLGPLMAVLMDLAILLSGLASILGSSNACAYMLYALGKQHYLPKTLGKFDLKLNSPKNAVNFTAILWALSNVIFGVPYGYNPIYVNGSTLGVLALLLVYMMVCLSSGVFFYKSQHLHFSWLKHGVVPFIGIAVLVMPLMSNIYPVPKYPANLFPYLIVLWIVLGYVIAYRRNKKASA